MKRMRSHPINILENTLRYLILLLLPVLRALFTVLISGGDFYSWLSGAWFDLLIFGIMLALGIYRWYIYTFSFNQDGIYIRKGIFFRQHRFLPFEQITTITSSAPWYYFPLHAVHMRADTDGGFSHQPDFKITVHQKQANRLISLSKHPFTDPRQSTRFYIPGNIYLAIFSLLTSSSLTGAIYVATAVPQMGNLFGQDIQNRLISGLTRLVRMLAFGLPLTAAIIGYTILGCWVFSFLSNLFSSLRFSASRRSNCLEIHSGLLTHRKYSIAVERINCLLLRQSLLTKLFGLFSVFIYCTGYGKSRGELNVLMPSGRGKELHASLRMLLPEIPLAQRQIKPKLVNLSRFLFPPTCLGLSFLAAGLLAMHFLPAFRLSFLWLTIIAEIPSVWWLIVKFYAFFRTGIGTDSDVITLYYTYGYRVLTCSIPRHKIAKITITQTLFQLPTKCCDVTFHVYGEKKLKQKVLNLNLPQVRELLQRSDEILDRTPAYKFTLWK